MRHISPSHPSRFGIHHCTKPQPPPTTPTLYTCILYNWNWHLGIFLCHLNAVISRHFSLLQPGPIANNYSLETSQIWHVIDSSAKYLFQSWFDANRICNMSTKKTAVDSKTYSWEVQHAKILNTNKDYFLRIITDCSIISLQTKCDMCKKQQANCEKHCQCDHWICKNCLEKCKRERPQRCLVILEDKCTCNRRLKQW